VNITDGNDFIPFAPRTALTGLPIAEIPVSAFLRSDGLEPYYKAAKRTRNGGYTATGIYLMVLTGGKL